MLSYKAADWLEELLEKVVANFANCSELEGTCFSFFFFTEPTFYLISLYDLLGNELGKYKDDSGIHTSNARSNIAQDDSKIRTISQYVTLSFSLYFQIEFRYRCKLFATKYT